MSTVQENYSKAFNSFVKDTLALIGETELTFTDVSLCEDAWNYACMKALDQETEELNEEHTDLFLSAVKLKEAKYPEYLKFVIEPIPLEEEIHCEEFLDLEEFLAYQSEIDQEDDALNIVNRAALLIQLKTPFADWLQQTFEDQDYRYILLQKEVLLIPGELNNENFDAWLQQNFDPLFCQKLNDWTDDESLWPVNRSLKMFKEWIHFEFIDLVSDSLNEPLEKF